MAKDWVIPDIHGCAKTLTALIEGLVKPTRNDRLYFLGDYIDRGPSSRDVIDYIMKMQADDYSIRLLIGNHEDYLLRSYDAEMNRKSFLGIKQSNHTRKEWLFHGGKETLESFGLKDVKQIPEKYLEWMRKLEYFIELDNFFLVHAGFNFRREDPFEDKTSMLWTRDYNIKPDKVKRKKIIHGHMPVSLEFIDMSLRNKMYWFIDLDNGCYMNDRDGFGNLVALELNSMEYVVQYNLDY
jgi:serine/threonine protein phosphatase 1